MAVKSTRGNKMTFQIDDSAIENEKPRLVSTKYVMNALGVSRTTLWRWVSSGSFPKPMNLGPMRTVWQPSDIDDFIEKLKAAGNVDALSGSWK